LAALSLAVVNNTPKTFFIENGGSIAQTAITVTITPPGGGTITRVGNARKASSSRVPQPVQLEVRPPPTQPAVSGLPARFHFPLTLGISFSSLKIKRVTQP
jgi:hypothetical protein